MAAAIASIGSAACNAVSAVHPRPAQGKVLPVRSPKLGGSVSSQYYRYYAGYTQGFVEDVLNGLSLPDSGLIIDPWNGAGTTTVAAAAAGINAKGFDVNPAAVVIGRARLLKSDVAGSLVPIAKEICERAATSPEAIKADDLLNTWFGPSTARELRSLERAASHILVDIESGDSANGHDTTLPHSSLASLFYVALFRTVRELVRRYVPSNPSWIKNPTGRRLGVSRTDLHASFLEAVKLSNPYQGQLEIPLYKNEVSPSVGVATSTSLPVGTASVDAVVSSPPYCTRLDYVKATLPELAIMGLKAEDIRELRDRMIGTPTIAGESAEPVPEEWGEKTNSLLRAIAGHSSKASATYYRKYYHQYFRGMWDSLNELHRVVKPDGSAVLVVQDSFYKDIHVDLPTLIGDMSESAGWSSWRRVDFTVPRTMAMMNPRVRRYRKDFGAVESAVRLER